MLCPRNLAPKWAASKQSKTTINVKLEAMILISFKNSIKTLFSLRKDYYSPSQNANQISVILEMSNAGLRVQNIYIYMSTYS